VAYAEPRNLGSDEQMFGERQQDSERWQGDIRGGTRKNTRTRPDMTSFAGIPFADKMWLVRKLVEERTKQSFFGRLFQNDIKKMDDAVLIGTPEGTVVTIVETYYALRKGGASAAQAFAAIEDHRSTAMPGRMPPCADLNDYIKYRVRLEHNRGHKMTDFEILRASSITSGFIEKFFNAGPLREEAEREVNDTPNLYFVSELPHPDVNRPSGVFRTGNLQLQYYENPKTIGSVTVGIGPAYKYPQVIVVLGDEGPLVIIRTEQSASGCLFLCSLDANGRHVNLGEVAPMSRDDFVRKAGEVLLRSNLAKKAE
jgi:hypothetical protein